MTRVVAAFLFLLLWCVACGDDDVVCPTDVAPALAVTIVDSLTGAPRSGIATAIATDGAYVDTLKPYGGDGLGTELSKAGAYGRAGTYDLRVTAPGYLEWTRTSIEVTSGECGVRTTQLEARLMLDPSNNAPVIAALPDTSVAVGDTLRMTAAAEDADGDTLRYGLTVFISWEERDPDLFPLAGIDSATGELWFVARPQDQPIRTLLVTVDDGRQGRDSARVVVLLEPTNELERQQAIWGSFGLTDYDLELRYVCFCGFRFCNPAEVFVRNGVVDSLRLNPDCSDPSEEVEAQFSLTIPDLFSIIEEAQTRGVDSVYVSYDSTMGYPTWIHVDEVFGIADDERTWSARLLATGGSASPRLTGIR